jgi:hypothetical protein
MNSTNKGPDAAVDSVAPTKKRTAVLVVHGMGSQRALDTVRGVVNSVWLDDEPSSKRYWMHPEKRDNDTDLSVITTNEIPGTVDNRSADFHELYWAHLMSETRAVAVLLWLFELVRKGPRLKRGMRALVGNDDLSMPARSIRGAARSARHTAAIGQCSAYQRGDPVRIRSANHKPNVAQP